MRSVIVIDEFGGVLKTNNTNEIEEWKEASDDGLASVIDITDPLHPKDWYKGEWLEIEKFVPYEGE